MMDGPDHIWGCREWNNLKGRFLGARKQCSSVGFWVPHEALPFQGEVSRKRVERNAPAKRKKMKMKRAEVFAEDFVSGSQIVSLKLVQSPCICMFSLISVSLPSSELIFIFLPRLRFG